MKRFFDVFLTLSALLLLFPMMLMVAIVIFFKLGTPIIFIQTRAGKFGKPFKVFKFRSMLDAKDKDGKDLPDSLRLTRFGRFLRSTSLDELPSLLNVIKGDMSLVGPRPLLMEYLPFYSSEQAKRHDVEPGITGWAQVNGRNAISWDEKFKLDVWYVQNKSFTLDVKILCLTLKKVFFREGISAEGHPTMPRFDELMLDGKNHDD